MSGPSLDSARGVLPAPCGLCGAAEGVRRADGWRCAVCGWRVGDAPDPELPMPRVDVVYYVRFRERVKIGTSGRPRQRLAAVRHEELLAFEPGDRVVERARHAQFAHLREGGEWFTAASELLDHVARVRGDVEPWQAYARWVSAALARNT